MKPEIVRAAVLSDVSLARRLERTEGTACAQFAEARARLSPEVGAEWMEVAGAYAVFDGIGSPVTQCFGLGMFEHPSERDLGRLESFFFDRGSSVFHEVCPLASKELWPLIADRGYRPVEFTNVLFQPLGSAHTEQARNSVRVRIAGVDEQEMWAQLSTAGWQEFEEYAHLMLELNRIGVSRKDSLPFLAEINGQPVATGSLLICDGVALLAGASTVPRARRQGAQLALLESRLRYAAEQGCDLAMMCAEPGSASQRNAERHGFRIAYTRTKWELRKT